MTQTHTQNQTQTPKIHTRTEFLETMKKIMNVYDHVTAIVYLNNVARDVLEANSTNYRVMLNPYKTENVAGIWISDEEKKKDNGEPIRITTVYVLYLTRVMVIYKLVSDPKTDRITNMYVFYRALCQNPGYPM